jgi:hypothetical protein
MSANKREQAISEEALMHTIILISEEKKKCYICLNTTQERKQQEQIKTLQTEGHLSIRN